LEGDGRSIRLMRLRKTTKTWFRITDITLILKRVPTE